MEDMLMTPEEIQHLTKRKQPTKQSEELTRLGYQHNTRYDGSIILHRRHVAEMLGCVAASVNKTITADPNWEFI